jgi:hypothetical protein
MLKDGRAAFRSLGPSLGTDQNAASPWVCIDDSAPNARFTSQAAVDGDGDGYAILVRETNGATVFRRLDSTGIGLP